MGAVQLIRLYKQDWQFSWN